MHPIMKMYKTDIEDYCAATGLFAREVFASAHSGTSDRVTLYRPPVFSNAKIIVADNTPIPIVLQIYLENGKLRFEQTDITHKYLGADRKTATVTKPTHPDRPSIPNRRELAFA